MRMRTFLIVLLTALLTLIWWWVALQEGLIPSTLFSWQDECTSTTVVKTYEEGECEVPKTGESCTTPRGTVAAHGDVILSFESASATLADGCVSKSSVCNDGSYMNDNDPFEFEACELDTPLNCEVNWFVFAHGTSEVFYEEGIIEDGEVTCASETRACEDWEASWWDSFEYKSCYAPGQSCEPVAVEQEVEEPIIGDNEASIPVKKTTATFPVFDQNRQPNCPSPFGWRRWEPGETRELYESASVPYGTTCQTVSVTCAFWSVRYWTEANPWGIAPETLSNDCAVLDPVPCSSACGTVNHGDLVTTYSQAPYSTWKLNCLFRCTNCINMF